MSGGRLISASASGEGAQQSRCRTSHKISFAADAMLKKGNLDGYAVWKRILRAVEELQRAEMEPATQTH